MIGRKIHVKSGGAKGFIEKVLTRDITTMASIFDLIDNAIDAAKEHKFLHSSESVELDEYNMPKDYKGYRISLVLSEEYFSVEDNCLGFDEEKLAEHAFLTGEESNHEFGLGKFGVGLKRALFKFGTNYSLVTDTGLKAFSMNFDNEDLGRNNEIEATEINSTGESGTRFEVRNLKEHVKNEFTSEVWLNKLKDEICARYGVFIDKGFEILLKVKNSDYEKLESKWPKIHVNHRLLPSEKVTRKYKDVTIYIEYGLHTEYELNAEYGVNNKLLKSRSPFGWYVICNDRVIEMAVREGEDYGWKKAWHNEYNGFVGYIRFHSKSVETLPWDSTKTKIITDDLIFLGLKDTLNEMALNYRRAKKLALKELKDTNNRSVVPPSNVSSSSDSNKLSSMEINDRNGQTVESSVQPQKPSRKGKHDPEKRQYLTYGDYRLPLKNKNLKRVYKELTSLNVEENTLAVALLARVFLENLYISYYEHRFGSPPARRLKTHNVMEVIINDLLSDQGAVLSKDERRAITALNSIKSNEHSPLSPKTLGANAHLAMYPKATELKIEWDNIDAIIAYFAEKTYG